MTVTMSSASAQFLALVATLLDELSPNVPVPDAALLQLHAIFGPMLMSALQLADRRDVVRITLPGRRVLYQVTSSAGAPYTLYLDLPERASSKAAGATDRAEIKIKDEPCPPSASPDPDPAAAESEDTLAMQKPREPSFAERAQKLGALFCPCPGFAYNSLTGDKTVFCKHVLAVLLADRLGKMIDTDMGLASAAGLVVGGGQREG